MTIQARTRLSAVRSPVALDAIASVLLAAVQILGAAARGWSTAEPGLSWLGGSLLLAQTLPVALRRRWPVPVWGVTVVATAAYGIADEPDVFVYLGPLVAIYTVAADCPRRTTLLVGAATLLMVPVAVVIAGGADPTDYYQAFLAPALAWALGEWHRSWRVHAAELAQRVAADHRRDMARELHDVVAHHVSMIVVEAEAAASRAEAGTPGTTADFDGIAATARSAQRELRTLVGLLHGGAMGEPRRPQPGLPDVEALVEGVRRRGHEVRLGAEGDLRDLPEALQLSAYRIVQEALTNSVRHSRSSRTEVLIQRGDGAVHIAVRDDGSGPRAGAAEGNGLRGIRERVALLGGEVQMLKRPGGYEIVADLPVPEEKERS